MNREIKILNAEKDGNDRVRVTFSDGTQSGYFVEDLLELKPIRLPTNTQHTPIAIVKHKTSAAYIN